MNVKLPGGTTQNYNPSARGTNYRYAGLINSSTGGIPFGGKLADYTSQMAGKSAFSNRSDNTTGFGMPQTNAAGQSLSGKIGGTQSGAFNPYNNGQAFNIDNAYTDLQTAWKQAFDTKGTLFNPDKTYAESGVIKNIGLPGTSKEGAKTTVDKNMMAASGNRNWGNNIVTQVKTEALNYLVNPDKGFEMASKLSDQDVLNFAQMIPDGRVAVALDAAVHKQGRFVDDAGNQKPIISNEQFNKIQDGTVKAYFHDQYPFTLADTNMFNTLSNIALGLRRDYGLPLRHDETPFVTLGYRVSDFMAYGRMQAYVDDSGKVQVYNMESVPLYNSLMQRGYIPTDAAKITEMVANDMFAKSDQQAFTAGLETSGRPATGLNSYEITIPSAIQLMPYEASTNYVNALSNISRGFDINGVQRESGAAISELVTMAKGNFALAPEWAWDSQSNAYIYTGKIAGVQDPQEMDIFLESNGTASTGEPSKYDKMISGYKDAYFNIVGSLNVPEVIAKYFNDPTKYDELYMKYRRSGSVLTWEEWLNQLDWSAEYNNAVSASLANTGARTNRTGGGGGVPRLRSVSY